MRPASGAAAVLLLVILLWASNSIMVKIVLREIDPLTLTWLCYLIAASVRRAGSWAGSPGSSWAPWRSS